MFLFNLLSPVARQYLVVFILNLGVLNVGLEVGWSSPVLVLLADLEQSPLSYHITATQSYWIANSATLGSVIGFIGAGLIVDFIGRKYCSITAGVLRVTGTACLLFASTVPMLVSGRFLSGLSDGPAFLAATAYAAEIASKELRGSVGSVSALTVGVGILISLAIGPFVSYAVLSIILLSFAILSAAPLVFLPDSPNFLFIKGKKGEAREVLLLFRGSEAAVADEMKEYEESIDASVNILDLLKSKPVLKSFGLSILLGGGVQLTGFTTLQYYLQSLLISSGTQLSSEMTSVILGCVQLISSTVAMFFVDRFRRKVILTVGLIGNMIGLLGLGIFFHLKVNEGFEVSGILNVLPLASFVVTYIFNCGGVMSIVWTVVAELFDNRARGVGAGVGTVSCSAFIFITGPVYHLSSEWMSPAGPFWMFMLLTGVVLVLIVVALPETKDKTFAEIQRALAGHDTALENNGKNKTQFET